MSSYAQRTKSFAIAALIAAAMAFGFTCVPQGLAQAAGGDNPGYVAGSLSTQEGAKTIDEVKAEIANLLEGHKDSTGKYQDPSSYQPSDAAAIELVANDYEALSDADKAVLHEQSPFDGQPYDRVLETAQWAVWSYGDIDNGTTLADGTYDGSSNPALSSEYSKGKSTSSRQKPWSVKDVTVQNGRATATITVESTTYTGIWMGGTTYPKTNTSGNCEFAGVPIDLNSTFYFAGISSSMPVPIAFSLTTTIKEPIVLEDGYYKLPELQAGPSSMFNHIESDDKLLKVEDDTATLIFTEDGSTASVGKYSRLAIGKTSELLAGKDNYAPDSDLPEGTQIIDGTKRADIATAARWHFEIPLAKSDAEAMLNNEENLYITIWNNAGSSAAQIPGWYIPANDIYLDFGTLGEKTVAPVYESPYEGEELNAVDVAGAGFGMFAPQEGTTAVLSNGKVKITFKPKNKTTYAGFYLDANIGDSATWADNKYYGADEEGNYFFELDDSYCGYAWPIAPVKVSDPTATTSKQYYFTIPAKDKLESEGGDTPIVDTTELEITNNTGMFKAVSASVETAADGSITLVMALSSDGYKWLYKGTYEQAVAANEAIAAGIESGTSNDKLIGSTVNGDGKYEFAIPIEDGETYVPIVAISQKYIDSYVNGQNAIDRAYYPRQFNLDLDALTLVTDDFKKNLDLTLTNNVSMFKPSTARLELIGGPNSNNFKADLVLTMGSTSFDKAFVGTYAEANAADPASDAVLALDDNKVFLAKAKWVEEPGKPETFKSLCNGEQFAMSFHSVSKDAWYERLVVIDEEAGTITFDPSAADYSAVEEALQRFNAIEDLSIYTEASRAALESAVDAVVEGKFASQQDEVDAMAQAIEDAIAGLRTLAGEQAAEDIAAANAAAEVAEAAKAEAEQAAEKAAASKAAADEAAKTPGDAAVAAAEQAAKDAEDAATAAKAYEEAAKAAQEAAEKAVKSANAEGSGVSDEEKSALADKAAEAKEAAEAATSAAEQAQQAAESAANAKTEAVKKAEEKAAADKAAAEKAAAEKAAAEKAAASNINTATVKAAQVKKASSLGLTTITLGPKVKKIAKNAFKGTKIKTVIVKTKKLTKKSIKGSLKGSQVKTVKVQIGSKKVNKKFVKKYKKIFTKKIAGKKAKVK